MPLPLRPTPPFPFLLVLALLPGCFDPLVTGIRDDTTTDAATETGADSSTSDGTTGIDPDEGSGPALPVCGDGVVEGDEVCDDGLNDGSYGGCSPDCTALAPHCGDGVQDENEACDDGDDIDGNGCNVDCVVSGTVLWTVTHDGADHVDDVGTDVEVDSVDNIIVAGRITSNGTKLAWIGKHTPTGEEIWTTTYSSPYGDPLIHDIAITPDDSIIAAGSTYNAEGNRNAWIRRYDPDGDIVWTDTHSGATGESDSATTVISDETGHIFAIIHEGQHSIGNGSVSLARKYTIDGRELWSIYQPPGVTIDDMTMLPSGSVLLAGRQGDPSLYMPLLQEMNSDGATEWQTIDDTYGPGWFRKADANGAGDVVLLLRLQEQNETRIIRTTADGQATWVEDPWAFLSSTQDAWINDLGQISCTGTAGQDRTLWTRKYLPDTSIAWTDTYNGPEALFGIDQGEAIARDSAGNVVTVGIVQDSLRSNTDIWIRKFAP